MMNTIEYRVDCQLLQYLHWENALGCRFPIGKTDQVGAAALAGAGPAGRLGGFRDNGSCGAAGMPGGWRLQLAGAPRNGAAACSGGSCQGMPRCRRATAAEPRAPPASAHALLSAGGAVGAG